MRLAPRPVVVTAAVLALTVGGAGAALLLSRETASAPAAVPAGSSASVEVVRGDLRRVEQVSGELGHGSPLTISGRGRGIVTWLPSAGVAVGRGEQLYRVDDSPVAVFYGDLPLYRTLTDEPEPPEQPGNGGQGGKGGKGGDAPPPSVPLLTGNDIDLVAANLAALGFYDGETEDATYGWTLSYAVAQWQESRGLDGTGVLAADEIVVTRGPVRVDEVRAQLGAEAVGEILTVTSTRRSVVLQVPPALAQSLAPGSPVRIALVDGTGVRTRITSIGAAVAATDDSGGPPTVAVVVSARRPGKLAGATLGPVTARITLAARRDVLHVPVAALLALAGGGHALERPDGTLVPVTLGMVADGLVEVEGIEDGATVVVAS